MAEEAKKAKKSTYSEEQVNEIVNRLKKHETPKAVGESMNIAPTVVRRLARKAGYYISKNRPAKPAPAKTEGE